MYRVKWIETRARRARREGFFFSGDKPAEWRQLILAILYADEEQSISVKLRRPVSYQVVEFNDERDGDGEVVYDTSTI